MVILCNLEAGSQPHEWFDSIGTKTEGKCYINDRNPGRGAIAVTSRLKVAQAYQKIFYVLILKNVS